MPVFKKNPNTKAAFYLRSGNAPAFKMMGSSPLKDVGTHIHPHPEPSLPSQGDTPIPQFQRSTVDEANLTSKQQAEYNAQISAARSQYRKDMPIVHKGSKNARKRNKFVKNYMSKFVPPAYVAADKKVKENVPEQNITLNAPIEDELTRYYHGNKTMGSGGGGFYGEFGDQPGLSDTRVQEITDWIKFNQGSGKDNITVSNSDYKNRNDSKAMINYHINKGTFNK